MNVNEAIAALVDGTVKVVSGSYTGNGSSIIIELGARPKFVIVYASYIDYLSPNYNPLTANIAIGGGTGGYMTEYSNNYKSYTLIPTDTGFQAQQNPSLAKGICENGTGYRYIAFI